MVTFVILAVVMIVGALGVVLLRQPVHAALSLVGTLLVLAVTYVALEAHFLAAVQVVVYAGAIMVLFLFVIMLLNVRDATGPTRPLPGLRWFAYAGGVVVAASVAAVAFWHSRPAADPAIVSANLQDGGPAGIADVLFGELLLAFHLVGVLLLTGVVGAVALVQRRAETAHGAPKSGALAAGQPAAPRDALGAGGPS
ncbi:MAG: NADH-quinone oxidoreductase subunit J [bacterium]|nr:NADH-quinone oxidoreductase subunit J [bacterium]